MADFKKFSRKLRMKPIFAAAAKRLTKQILRNAARLNRSRPLSGYTKAVTGKSTPSTLKAAQNVPVRFLKRTLIVGHKNKGSGSLAHRLLMKGSKTKITYRQQLKLRSMGVRAGLFTPGVLSVPPGKPPFAVGSEKLQPSRNPIYMLGEKEVEETTEDLLDNALSTWGFQ